MTRTDLALTIFYVDDLQRAAEFYDSAFGFEKTVTVPVYVEYVLTRTSRLGLMSQGYTKSFLGEELGSRSPVDGSPRGELYLRVSDLGETIARLEKTGAVCTSPLADRDWGDRAAYFLDLDGYVIAVAQPL